jgi:hypothetical protein
MQLTAIPFSGQERVVLDDALLKLGQVRPALLDNERL